MAKRKQESTQHIGRDNLEPGWNRGDEAAYQETAAADQVLETSEVQLEPDLVPANLVACVEVPIDPSVPSEFQIHVDMTLTPPAATKLRRIASALDRQQARTLDGQRVTKPMHALRWLLEQMEIQPQG